MASMDTPAKRNEMGWRGHNLAKYELLTKCLKNYTMFKKGCFKIAFTDTLPLPYWLLESSYL